jgi:hypothetical protein
MHVLHMLLIDLTDYEIHRYGGYGSPGWGHGVRDFVFSANNVTGGVDTWIRLEDGRKRAIVRLDKNFS